MDPSVRDVVFGALTLNDEVFVSLALSSHPIALSTLILFLAGLAWMLGHCAMLFLSRVSPGRFLITLVALAFSFVLGALIWVGSTWLVATILPGNRNVPLRTIFAIAAFAYAPLVLSVFIIIPYAGSALEAVLNTWTLLALVLAVQVAFEMSLIGALACAGLGWLVTRLLPRLAGGRLGVVFNNAWYRVNSTGVRSTGEAAASEAIGRLRGS